MLRSSSRGRVQPATAGAGGKPARVLLIGGTSEIGLAILAALNLSPDAEVLLAGRDTDRMRAAAATLPCRITTVAYDALDADAQRVLPVAAFADGPVDLVISAAGVLTPQQLMDGEPRQAAALIDTNFTSHVAVLLGIAAQLRKAGRGTIVILSSVAAIRPRKANFVYGAAKAGLDAFGRGLADSLHGSGVRVLLVRPGFVIGRMTAGMAPAPLASTPAEVGAAVANALTGTSSLVFVPRSVGALAVVMRLIPRPLWRRLRR
jgi:decaprenylphospho-beta-D-erythro-pentofuranosid-2-ulose 2-reductase